MFVVTLRPTRNVRDDGPADRNSLASEYAARTAVFALILILGTFLSWSAARAETAIYFSPTDGAFGWCIRDSRDAAHGCASRYCKSEHDGGSCEEAIACSGGWAAAAYAKDWARIGGFGASCGFRTAAVARQLALAACMGASNDLCSTSASFAGSRTSSEKSNREFDLVWVSQSILNAIGYDVGTVDGKMGPRTRKAIAEFENALGRTATGQIDDVLLSRLLDAVGGAQTYVRLIRKNILNPNEKLVSETTYAYARAPSPEKSFSDTLEERSQEQRLTALATFLAAAGAPCRLPARRAERKSEHVWWVDCEQSAYEVDLLSRRGRKLERTAMSEEQEGQSGAEPEDALSKDEQSSSDDRRGRAKLRRASVVLNRGIAQNLQFFKSEFGSEFMEQMRQSYRDQGKDFEQIAREVCPVKDNAALVIEDNGDLTLVMNDDPNKKVARGRPLSDPAFLDPNPDTRRLMIEYAVGVLADGINARIAGQEQITTMFARCMIRALNAGHTLVALGYAQALADEGDELWAELAGLIYGSGDLLHRDFNAAEKYLRLAAEGDAQSSAVKRVERVLDLIDSYRKSGGEMVVLDPA